MEHQANQSLFQETRMVRLLLFLFFLIGLILRIYKLGEHNFWCDEFGSFCFAKRLVLRYIIQDCQSPLYYSLLHLWMKLFGSSEFALRSLSMFFGLLLIPLVYKLGKLIFDARTGLISAFMLSISALHIWYSQEARGYILSTFLVTLIVYLLYLVLKMNKINYWIAFFITLSIGLYTNYFTLFIIIVATKLFFQKEYRYLLKRWLVGCLFTFSLFLLWLPAFLNQISYVWRDFWIPKPHLQSILITFENFNVGYNATPEIYFFTFIIFSLLFILGVQRWWKKKRKELITLILFIFIPIIFTYLISQVISIYLDRQLMLFSPFYYIIIAAGLRKIKTPIIKTATYFSISLPILICLHNYFSYHMPLPHYHHVGAHVKKLVTPAAGYINNRFKEEDIIAFSSENTLNMLYYISEKLDPQIAIFFIGSELKKDKYLYKKIREILILQLQDSKERLHIFQLKDELAIPEARHINELKFKRVWLISSSWSRDRILEGHTKAVREFMQSHYLLLDSKEFDGIFVDLYNNPKSLLN